MPGLSPLTQVFHAHSAAADADSPPADLEAVLEALYQQVTAAWPSIDLPASDFVRRLAQHRPAQRSASDYLAAVNANDLYLACGCARGIAAALEAFDRSVLSDVPSYVARIDRSPTFAEEVGQLLRTKLLVAGEEGTPPRIAEYAGTGSLAGWVRVAAVRTALNQKRNLDDLPHDSIDEKTTAEALQIDRNPELDYMKAQYRTVFRETLQLAFSSLSRDQRNVLRLHFAGGLTGDKIASLLKINRSTVVRWLASAREGMLDETRRLLRQRLRLDPAELHSFIEVVRSQFDASLNTLLKSAKD